MATSFPSVVRTDYDADDFATTDEVDGLYDIAECVLRTPFQVYFTEQTRTDTAYGDMHEWEQFVPDYWAGRTLYIVIEGKVSGGTGTWCVVDADDSDTIISDERQVTYTVAYAITTATITVPSGWTADARRSLAIQGKATSGDTLYLQCTDVIRCYVSD